MTDRRPGQDPTPQKHYLALQLFQPSRFHLPKFPEPLKIAPPTEDQAVNTSLWETFHTQIVTQSREVWLESLKFHICSQNKSQTLYMIIIIQLGKNALINFCMQRLSDHK